MKKPAPLVYLLGHPVVGLALYAVAAFIAISWWLNREQSSPILLVMALLIGGSGQGARQKLDSFRAYQREWDDISGVAPAARRRLPRWLGAIVVWLVMSAWVVFGDMPTAATIGWLLASAVLVLLAVRAMWKALFRRRARPAPSQVVTVCLPVPKTASTPLQALGALPSYCRALLAPKPSA